MSELSFKVMCECRSLQHARHLEEMLLNARGHDFEVLTISTVQRIDKDVKFAATASILFNEDTLYKALIENGVIRVEANILNGQTYEEHTIVRCGS